LARLLADADFRLGWRDQADECGFVRRSGSLELYEQLIVKSVGKYGEAVFANAAVSIVSGPMATKGMVEMHLLEELATDQERGWAVIESEKQITKWEQQLAEVGPRRARELALRKGYELLNRTESARRVVGSILVALPPPTDLDALYRWLQERTPEAERAEAARLAQWAGVMRLRGGEIVYHVAALALETLVHLESDLGRDPIENPELMWQIQLLVDRLVLRYRIGVDLMGESKRGE
jgi:hypothetical protein